jgi:hypothetical protein
LIDLRISSRPLRALRETVLCHTKAQSTQRNINPILDIILHLCYGLGTMKRRWLDFEKRPNRTSIGEVRVTLNERGLILLNAKAFSALGRPGAATLHYDEDERIIGIRPAEARLRSAFPLKKKHSHYTYRVIFASPFCKHFRIKVQRTVQFNQVDIDDDGTMTLPLRSTTSIGRGSW